MECFEQKSKECFSQKEISIIREMLTVGSISTPGIDQYLENIENYKQEIQANKILYKLGYVGYNKDGTDNEDYSK